MGFLAKAVKLLVSVTVLDQTITNGLSLLGTKNAPLLPKFLSDGLPPDTFPWGRDTTRNTDAYHNSPNTGRTRKYDFTLQKKLLSPDGFEKDMIVVNGQYPGPTIEGLTERLSN
jgi:hypothetical protein